MTRWLRIIGIAVGALVLLVLLLAAALLGTAPGARLVLGQLVPEDIEIGAVHGRLLGPLVLEDIRYAGPGMEAGVARVRVDWRPTRLLSRRVEITTLDVDTADIRLLESDDTEPAGDGAAGPPSIPIAVRLESLVGREIGVVTAGGDTVRTARIVLAGGARQDTFDVDSLRLRDLDVRGSRYQLDAGGSLVTGASGARDSAGIEVEWSGQLADGRELAGRGTVQGAGGVLAVEHRLTAPLVARLDGRVRDPWMPDSLRWTLTVEVPRFALDRVADGVAGEVALTAEASGDLRAAQADVAAEGARPGLGPVVLDTRVAYRDGTIAIDTLRVRQLQGPARLAGGGRIALGDSVPAADLRLAWQQLGWPLDSATVSSPDGSLRVTGSLAEFHATADVGLRQPERSLGDWAVELDGRYVDGRLVVPGLVARMAGGGRIALTADVGFTDGPAGEATVEWADLGLPAAGDSARISSREGRVEISGGIEDFTVIADASVAGPALPLDRLRLDARGSVGPDTVAGRVDASGLAGDTVALELTGRATYARAAGVLVVDTVDVRLPATGGVLALRGEVDLSDPERRLMGRVRWRDIGWPLRAPRYRSAEGELAVTGEAGRIRLTGGATLGGATLPESRWRLAGQGDRGRFVVDSIRGSLLDGTVRAAGVVWPDSGAWELEVAGDSLDPARWRDGWTGRVAFRVRTDGRLGEAGPRFQATLDTLRGTLRERALAGRAVARGDGGGVTVDTLRLEAGSSTITAAGSIGDTLDLGWQLDAASLYDLVPIATGALRARGRVTGPRAAPSVTLSAEGSGLTVAGWTADSLVAGADIADAARDSSRAALTLMGVRGASVALDSVMLDAAGSLEAHAVTLLARSPHDTLESRVTGALADGGWAGTLRRLRLRSALAGSWRLRDSARIAISADSGAVDELCWVGDGELCLAASWGAADARWSASGQALPMEFLRPVLPQQLVARGAFDLESQGRTGAGPVPTGTFRLTGTAGELDFSLEVGQVVTQPYDGFVVEAASDSAGLDGRVELRLGALGAVTADATLPGRGPIADRGLEGRLDLHLEDDGTVSRFVPMITESRGTADAEVELAGTVRAPQVRGRIELSDAGAVVTSAGIHLTDGTLTARSVDGGRWELEGGVVSDTSRLAIDGFARPPDPDSSWLVDVTLEADTFPAFQTPELTIIVSPRLELRASPDSVVVDGRIAVPRARITVQELEGNVSVSPDVVVVGADDEAPDSMATPAAVRARVTLVLGDSVTIDALGLTGGLDGQLAIEAMPDRPPVGNGELQIEDGQYRIYRQTFQIDRGRLLFASTPLTNPGLDLRVTRESRGVTAGMDITGRADDPRVQLFSDPALSDEEILAYLIVGRPLRRLSQSEGSQVQNMAQSIGVAGGNLLLARLGSVFGLETARIERTDPDDEGERETSVVLGREILPRVHVDYAIGLRGAANVLRIRYMITDHWIFQTESGEETGADLLYTFGGGAGAEIPDGESRPEPPQRQPPGPQP